MPPLIISTPAVPATATLTPIDPPGAAVTIADGRIESWRLVGDPNSPHQVFFSFNLPEIAPASVLALLSRDVQQARYSDGLLRCLAAPGFVVVQLDWTEQVLGGALRPCTLKGLLQITQISYNPRAGSYDLVFYAASYVTDNRPPSAARTWSDLGVM